MLVARLFQWWLEGRIVGNLTNVWLNRKLVFVGRVVPYLRKRMNGWVVEKMGWMLETRMLNLMFKMVVRRMLTVMVLIVNLSR